MSNRDRRNLVFLDEIFSFDFSVDIESKVKTSYVISMNLDSFVSNPSFELNHQVVLISYIHRLMKLFSKLNSLYEHQMNEDFHVVQDAKEISSIDVDKANHVVLHCKLQLSI